MSNVEKELNLVNYILCLLKIGTVRFMGDGNSSMLDKLDEYDEFKLKLGSLPIS